MIIVTLPRDYCYATVEVAFTQKEVDALIDAWNDEGLDTQYVLTKEISDVDPVKLAFLGTEAHPMFLGAFPIDSRDEDIAAYLGRPLQKLTIREVIPKRVDGVEIQSSSLKKQIDSLKSRLEELERKLSDIKK